jgi:hypothetical protein
MIKALKKLGIEGMFFNIIKAIYNKPTASVILNRENSESISSEVKNNKGVHTLHCIELEFLVKAVRQEKEKGYKQERKKSNYPYSQM